MAIQYPYPERGWSTGNMRMAKAGPRDSGSEFRELEGQRKKKEARVAEADIGEAAGRMSDHPLVETMERLHKSRKEAQGDYPALTPEQWANWQQQFPQGQMIDAEHPQLNEVAKTHDLYTIPNQWEKFLFMNPKQQQTTGQAGGG